MGTVIMIAQLILALAILVSLHEWGHYIAARTFGIRVEKFFIFFDAWGIKLFSKKINDTEWGVGWLPLGGYVKISGMIDESLDSEQLGTEAQDHEFRSKPAWQRLIVMIGGVTVNFILGILIFALSLWYYGETRTPNKVAQESGIYVEADGEKMGFKEGDKLQKVNGIEVPNFEDFSNPALFLEGDEPIVYDIERDGEAMQIVIANENKSGFLESKGKGYFGMRGRSYVSDSSKKAKEIGFAAGDYILSINDTGVVYYNQLKALLARNPSKEVDIAVLRGSDTVSIQHTLSEKGLMGIAMDPAHDIRDRLTTKKFGFFESFPAGTKKGLGALTANILAFKKMFTGEVDPVKTVSGPAGIAKIYGKEWIWSRFWAITGMLSFILAFMNLLPIPALDGGHVLFLLIEMLRGKPLSDKVMYYFQIAGMIILFALMGFIIFIDAFNIVTGQ